MTGNPSISVAKLLHHTAGLVVLTVVAITSFLAPIRIRQLGSANAISISVIGVLTMLALLA